MKKRPGYKDIFAFEEKIQYVDHTIKKPHRKSLMESIFPEINANKNKPPINSVALAMKTTISPIDNIKFVRRPPELSNVYKAKLKSLEKYSGDIQLKKNQHHQTFHKQDDLNLKFG